MALIVEDGTGVANAESYATVLEATARHTAYGNADAWDNVEDKEAALRQATQYITDEYRSYWAGYRATTSQALDWPRSGVPNSDYEDTDYAINVVPNDIKNVTIDLALKAANGELMPDVERLEKSVKIGPIAIEYDGGSSPTTVYSSIIARLNPYLAGNGFSVGLVRT